MRTPRRAAAALAWRTQGRSGPQSLLLLSRLLLVLRLPALRPWRRRGRLAARGWARRSWRLSTCGRHRRWRWSRLQPLQAQERMAQQQRTTRTLTPAWGASALLAPSPVPPQYRRLARPSRSSWRTTTTASRPSASGTTWRWRGTTRSALTGTHARPPPASLTIGMFAYTSVGRPPRHQASCLCILRPSLPTASQCPIVSLLACYHQV